MATAHGRRTIPSCLLVAYALLAIDEISAVIEAPFHGYLPMKELYAKLLLDVGPYVGRQEVKTSRIA